MVRGLRDILHVARKMLGEVQGWVEDSWAHDSHPESGAWKARYRNSCVASYPSMRLEAVVEEVKSAEDVVWTTSPRAHGPSN
jgi:7,8-dihydro-6-hydroxymethylpterin-pyrophosphokinase